MERVYKGNLHSVTLQQKYLGENNSEHCPRKTYQRE